MSQDSKHRAILITDEGMAFLLDEQFKGSRVMQSITLCDGKYEFFRDQNNNLLAKRNGKLWREFIGDKAINALFDLALQAQANDKVMTALLTSP